MASTSFDSSRMETSTFLRDIADFDIKGPISVTICYEDDIDEQPIKTEINSDDNQNETPIIDNSAFVPILEPKKEAQVVGSNSVTLTEEFCNSLIVQNNFQDNVRIPEKRKPEVQPSGSSPKKCKPGVGIENNYDKENLQISHFNEKDGLLNSTSARKNENVLTNSVDSLLNERSKHSVIVNGLPQNEIDKINVCITNCLATISDHMRSIMESFDIHKQHKISKETFNEIKFRHFTSVFKYIYTILLPEEKNSEFIQTFLKDTVQRANNIAGPNHVRTYQDYANLLREMIKWAKYQICLAKKKNVNTTATPAAAETNTLVGEKHPALETQRDNTKSNYSNVSANADKLCLFSSGPPGREFSIDIDPVKYSRLTGQDLNTEAMALPKSCAMNEPQKSESANNQLKETIESLKEFAAKCHEFHKVTKQPAIQTEVLQISKVAATQFIQHPEQSIPSTNLMRNLPPNYDSATQQMKARAPLLQTQLDAPQMSPLPLHQQIQPHQQKTQAPSCPYGILPHLQAQYDQARQTNMQSRQDLPAPPQYGQAHLKYTKVIPPQCDPLRSLQAQTGQNQLAQPRCNRAQLMQKQNTSILYQSGHSLNQLGQKLYHEVQQQYMHTRDSHISQQQRPSEKFPSMAAQQQYMHTRDSHISQQQRPSEKFPSMAAQQQYMHTRDSQISQQQRPSEKFPSMAALLSQDSMLPSTHVLTNLSQDGQREYMQQQNKQSNYTIHQNFGSTHYYQTHDTTLFGQWQSRSLDAQQSQPMPAPGSQWHQELNAIYQGGVPPQTQKGSPRAASTDSGFISPLNFNMSTDQMMPATPQEPETSMPLITHVTSLSEKAAFVENGKCAVCKKNTKQMCMGCMRIYYCTYQCQSQHWSSHAAYCSQTTNHGSTQPS